MELYPANNAKEAKIVIAFISVLIISLFPTPSFCEIQTITHTVKQAFGGSQSADDALISAVAKAKREALEMAGVYVEALTIVKDAKVDKDEILAISAGVLKSEIVSQKNYITGEAFGIEVVAKIIVDTSVLESSVKKLLQDRTHLDQLNQARNKEKELLDEVARLGAANQRLMAKKQSTGGLKKQFQDVSQGLKAIDWFNKALALLQNDKFTDPIKAIEYLNESIRLNPNNSLAYFGRGQAYFELNQHQRAIDDYSELMRLAPHNKNLSMAYNNRGIAYANLDQFQSAIKDFDEAIRRRPDSDNYYEHRGTTYLKLGQNQRAIEDFNEAIRLNPKNDGAWNNRGGAYLLQGNYNLGCHDVQKACELGNCKMLEFVKGKGYCR